MYLNDRSKDLVFSKSFKEHVLWSMELYIDAEVYGKIFMAILNSGAEQDRVSEVLQVLGI